MKNKMQQIFTVDNSGSAAARKSGYCINLANGYMRLVLLLALCIFMVPEGRAQISITAADLTYEQRFDAFKGTAASVTSDLPGWTVSSLTDQGIGCGSKTNGGLYAFGNSGEYALGYLPSSSSPNSSFTATVTFVNNTGATITALDISYNFENWRREARTNGFAVTSNAGDVSALNYTPPTSGQQNCTVVTVPLSKSLAVNIANGATFYIRWSSDRGGGSGSSQGIGIDDFKITATIPAACNITSAGTIASTAGNNFCGTASTTLSLNGTNPSTGITYQWKSSPDSISWVNAGTSATQAVNATNTVYYKCIVKCSTGTASDSTPGYKITVNQAPTATISSGTNVCSGDPATITFNGTANATVTYTAGTLSRTITLNGSGTASITPQNFTTDTTYAIVSAALGTCSQNISGQQAAVHVNARPTATVSGGTNVCSGDPATITFNGTANATVTYTAGTLSRTITLNGSGTASITPQNFTTDTTYAIVSAALGTCSQNISGQQAAVHVNVRPTATISGGTNVCSGDPATITFNGTANATVTYTAGALSRTITLNGSGTAPITPQHFTTDTTYTIVSATLGTCSQNISGQQAAIHVNTPPAASISSDTAICFGATTAIAFTGTPGATVTYNAGSITGRTAVLDGTGTVTFSYPFAADTTYAITSVSDASCSRTISGQQATVHVNPLPSHTVQVAGATVICEGDSVMLSAPAGTGYSYQWKNGTADAVRDQVFPVKQTGVYKVVVTDDNNCTDSSAAIAVTAYVPPVLTITEQDTAFCSGGVVTLHAGTPDTGLDFRWRNGGTDIPNATADFLEINATGTYSVFASRTHVPNCADTSAAVAVTVYPVVAPDIRWDGQELSTDTYYVSYRWYSGSTSIDTAGDAAFIPPANGGYSVTVTDSNGCTGTSSVYNVHTLDVHNAAADQQITIYPNPTTGILYIGSPGDMTIMLSSTDGRALLKQQHIQSIDIRSFADGIYFLHVLDDNGMLIRNERIIKRSY